MLLGAPTLAAAQAPPEHRNNAPAVHQRTAPNPAPQRGAMPHQQLAPGPNHAVGAPLGHGVGAPVGRVVGAPGTHSLITADPSTGFTLLRSSIRMAGRIAAGPSVPFCRRSSSHPLTITPIGRRWVWKLRNPAFSGYAMVPIFCSSMSRPARSSTLFRTLSSRTLRLCGQTIARPASLANSIRVAKNP